MKHWNFSIGSACLSAMAIASAPVTAGPQSTPQSTPQAAPQAAPASAAAPIGAADIEQVAAALQAMGAAANAHDAARHVGFYAHDPSVMLIYNGEPISGWDAILAQQIQWWHDGKTDVVYTPKGKPSFVEPAPGLVLSTLLMKSRRTMPDGEVRDGEFAVSSVWQKRAEGWRVIFSHESTTQRR